MFYIKKNIAKLTIILMLILVNICYASGNLNNFELGTAMYTNLKKHYFGSAEHYHAGVFNYFEYTQNGIGKMSFTEGVMNGVYNNETTVLYIGANITQLSQLKNSLKDKFRANTAYQGAYSKNTITPETHSSIVATARALGSNNKLYTFLDMLDSKNIHGFLGWEEDWQGTIYDIDELRCDGVVEFSYEKNSALVTKTYLSCFHTTAYDNISTPGNSILTSHNCLHDGTYDCTPIGEICPRIQAGEDHRGSGTARSYFFPLASANPVISNFSYTENGTYPSLNFKISDNTSVKSYVLIQVKRSSESTWHTMVDMYNNKWQFKSVDLTNYDPPLQNDFFHVNWSGSYEGGRYPANSTPSNFDIKITTIDQGANYIQKAILFQVKYLHPFI